MPLGANTRSQSGWFAGLLLEVGTIFVHKVARGGGAMGGAIRYLYLPTYWRGTCSFVSRGRDLLGLLLLTVRPMQCCCSCCSAVPLHRAILAGRGLRSALVAEIALLLR